MRVSFDFDGVLTTYKGKRMLVAAQRRGDIVFIVTSRPLAWKKQVYAFAKAYDIPVTRVIFTSYLHKWEIINKKSIDKHFDNNPDELELIRENTDASTYLI
mgnify:FL=1